MKKSLLILLTVSMIMVLVACGSSDYSTNEEAESSETEEIITEEKEMGACKGIIYSYPSGWNYYETDGGYVILASEDNQTTITLTWGDVSGYGLDSDGAVDYFYDYMLSSVVSGYDEVQDESTKDTTIAGHKAKEMTATVSSNGTLYNYDCAIVVDQDEQYTYGIAYSSNTDSAGYPDVYQDLLNSIEFNPDLIGDRD